ncbi:MAG: DUF2312 domain-containing protein [Holosporales bacterium]
MSNVTGIAAGQLRQFIERIERLENDKAEVAADIREVFGEAKSQGFDPKIMRVIIRLRKMERAEREEQEELVNLYLSAVEGATIRASTVMLAEDNQEDTEEAA